MTSIENYLYDGAGWQARAVMCYLQDCYESILSATYTGNAWDSYEGKIGFVRYDGCREQGYTFMLRYKDHQRNYAVYRHCISDCICVVTSDAVTETPNGWDGKPWDKYEHDAEFSWDEVIKCGKWIENDMKEYIHKWQKAEGRYKNEREDED